MQKELVYSLNLDVIEAIKNVQSESTEVQRLKFFKNKLVDGHAIGGSYPQFTVMKCYLDNENHVFTYVRENHHVMLSSKGKVFTRNSWSKGFTYYAVEGEIDFWRGTGARDIPIDVLKLMLTYAKAEWALENFPYREPMDAVYNYFNPMFINALTNKALLKRVLKGRITNGEALLRAYLKTSPMWRDLKISERAPSLLKLMRDNNFEGRRHYMTLEQMHSFLSIVSNVDATIDMFLAGHRLSKTTYDRNYELKGKGFNFFHLDDQIQYDIAQECKILDKKINSTWSCNRLMNEHTLMSREIRDIELSILDKIEYPYSEPLPVLPGMELIQDNHRLFTEGKEMDHCIFNYADQAVRRELFHFHCTFGKKPFSLAVRKAYSGDRWVVQQMFGKRNSSCTDDQQWIVEQWLNERDVQEWFTNEHKNSNANELPF